MIQSSVSMLSSSLSLPLTIEDYDLLEARLKTMGKSEWMHAARVLGRRDLYFLLKYILTTRDWKKVEDPKVSIWRNPWLLERCREAQFQSINYMDIWARGHFKSTIKTLGLVIQWIINNPNETIGIFSVTKAVADEFVSQVRNEIESNRLLRALYPDIFWEDGRKEAKRWTIEKGFTVKQTLNLKDATVRGFGLLDTNFTGHRISKGAYDDSVNEANISTPDMVLRTTRQFELSLGTAMPGSGQTVTGTFYMYGDSYHDIAEKGFTPRIHPCYQVIPEESSFDKESGLPNKIVVDRDKPVLFPKEYLLKVEKEMGPTTFATQMLCNPVEGSQKSFHEDWLRFYKNPPGDFMNTRFVHYIVVDPANEKNKRSSYTVMWVIALGEDGNMYVVDGVVDRIHLESRVNKLFELVRKWKPYEVRYEKYALQADTQYIQILQDRRNFRFNLIEVGGSVKKEDRIERLIPHFKDGKVWFPNSMPYLDESGRSMDLTREFIRREYLHFPNTQYMDMLDSLSRIAEPNLGLAWPSNATINKFRGDRPSAWAGALQSSSLGRNSEKTWMAQ